MQAARAEAAASRTQADELGSRISSLSAELHLVSAERDKLSNRLAEELAHSAQLEEQVILARTDIQDAEEEIIELREAKSAD